MIGEDRALNKHAGLQWKSILVSGERHNKEGNAIGCKQPRNNNWREIRSPRESRFSVRGNNNRASSRTVFPIVSIDNTIASFPRFRGGFGTSAWNNRSFPLSGKLSSRTEIIGSRRERLSFHRNVDRGK